MIELRWLEDDRLGEAVHRVLQYRVQERNVTFHGKAGPHVRWEWGEWQEVPTVSAPSNTAKG